MEKYILSENYDDFFPSSESAKSLIIWPIVQFDKEYEILDKLGEGKFGEVFKVRRNKCRRVFAAKFMRCQRASEKLRVRDEIEILQLLDHRNVLKLVGAHEDENNFIQVLEYLPGGQLFQRIVQSDHEITEEDIVEIIRQICEACRYIATFSVVHLDLKPENIVCSQPQGFHVKLVDFGFARRLDPSLAPMRVNEGTPEFASPEVIAFEPISMTTDMWSVGVLTYVLLSGLSPFLGDDNEATFDNITSLSYTFDEPEFEPISDSARDFIGALLVLSPLQRMTAAQALRHPWLAEPDDEPSLARRNADQHSVAQRKTSYDRRRLKVFTNLAKTRWKMCANVIRACKTLQENVQV